MRAAFGVLFEELLQFGGQQMLDAYNNGEFNLITLDAPAAEKNKTIELNPPKDSNYKGLLD